MKVLVVIGHQREGSFCHAIAEAAREALQSAGHDVIYHDLYAEHFDPILPDEEVPKGAVPAAAIEQHAAEVSAADGYIVVHPNWWAMPPAILKGWIDRVFRQGVTYEFGAGGVIGYLKGKTALVFTTSNTPREIELEWFGDPLENLWKNCVFCFCGMEKENFRRRNFEPIILSTPEQRCEWLADVRKLVQEYFPVKPFHG
jgi:putative NADPH-quinone reductase